MSVDIGDRIYEAYSGEMGPQLMHEAHRHVHWVCSAVQAESVLDVGCGQGLVPILLAREGRNAVGLDSSAAAIASADEHLAKEALGVRKRVSFVEADFSSHDFGETRFDCVIMARVLDHLLEPQRFLAKAANLLKPGGRLIVTVPFGWSDHAEHKHTFYLLEPHRLVAEHFAVEQVAIVGKWLGLVATRREAGVPAEPSYRDLQNAEQAFMSIERELLDAANGLRARLEDANTKYRGSTEEVAKLKREVAQHESERKAAEKVRERAEQELQEQRRHSVSPAAGPAPSDEIAKEVRARHAAELELARLDERARHATKLTELERRVKDSELAKLEGFRAQLVHQVQALETQLAGQSALVAQAKTLQQDLHARDEQLSRVGRQLAGTQEVVRELEASAEATRTRLESQERELVSTQTALTEAHAALAQATALAAAQAAAAASSKELEELRNQVQAEAVLRGRADEHTRALERQLSEHKQLLSDRDKRIAELDKLVRATRNAAAGGALQAEKRGADQVRRTLSFQLGHELIHGFKSREGLKALPKQLWELQQEANRRRAGKTQKALPEPKLPWPRSLIAKRSASTNGNANAAQGQARPTAAISAAPSKPRPIDSDDDLLRG